MPDLTATINRTWRATKTTVTLLVMLLGFTLAMVEVLETYGILYGTALMLPAMIGIPEAGILLWKANKNPDDTKDLEIDTDA